MVNPAIPQGMGRMGRMMGQMAVIGSGTEILYSFVIIVCSLMIYFGTRELYELSSHKGIKYFRQAFLFFALAYFFRSFIKLLVFYFNVPGLYQIPRVLFSPLISQATLFLFMYFSFMAVFYLVYSLMWKNWNGNKIFIFHVVAILMALAVLSRDALIYIGLNLLLFVFVLFVFIYSHNHSKNKMRKLYVIYFLLLFFWILNIIDILLPRVLIYFQLSIYLFSLVIFLIILYKTLKATGN
jgi:hypothetical protein